MGLGLSDFRRLLRPSLLLLFIILGRPLQGLAIDNSHHRMRSTRLLPNSEPGGAEFKRPLRFSSLSWHKSRRALPRRAGRQRRTHRLLARRALVAARAVGARRGTPRR